jgi:hypothetical protein
VWRKLDREAGGRVGFGASARIGAIAASLAAAAALLLPSTALAATEIGSAQGSLVCTVTGFDSVQVTSSGNTYVVPAGGSSITSWSVLAGPDTGPVGLEVWQPSTTTTYTLAATVPDVTLAANTMNTFTLAAPIAVQPGEIIGLRVDGPVACLAPILNPDGTPSTADTVGFSFGPQPVVGGTALMGVFSGFQINVAAGVEITVNPPPPPPTPTSTDQCMHGGWQGLADSKGTLFKNQGDCVSFVATGGTNLAG